MKKSNKKYCLYDKEHKLFYECSRHKGYGKCGEVLEHCFVKDIRKAKITDKYWAKCLIKDLNSTKARNDHYYPQTPNQIEIIPVQITYELIV